MRKVTKGNVTIKVRCHVFRNILKYIPFSYGTLEVNQDLEQCGNVTVEE